MIKVKVPALLITAVAALALLTPGAASGFHDGGVGACEGCHTVHNSSSGRSMTSNAMTPGRANAYLLLDGDSSSTCLNCHEHAGDLGPTTFHVSTPEVEMPPGLPPKQLSPGGDFGWLKKTFSWVPAVGQGTAYSVGERHGHNIRSASYGYAQDATHATAPGGSYPSASLGCISCHDPHGKFRRNQDGSESTSGKPIKGSGSFDTSASPDSSASVGSYRLLAGNGYIPKSLGNVSYAFMYGTPAAVAPEPANRSEDTTPTRVAYGSGMSEWCRNCHSNIHNALYSGGVTHLSDDPLGPTIINNYNIYIKTGNISGVVDNSYSSLVPFEIGTSNYGTLKNIVTTTPAKGPDTADGTPSVMCLTCHRAHASGWDGATRWNTKTDYIAYNGAYSQQNEIYQPYGQGRNETEAQRAYYNTPVSNWALNQKTLCNKCHISDGS